MRDMQICVQVRLRHRQGVPQKQKLGNSATPIRSSVVLPHLYGIHPIRRSHLGRGARSTERGEGDKKCGRVGVRERSPRKRKCLS